MANNIWSNYTEKTATPVDTDEVMVRDSTDGKNKRLLFGTFWKWVANKLNEATISELKTDNKTIIGAINTLNGKSYNLSLINSSIYDVPYGYSYVAAMATDKPTSDGGFVIRLKRGNDAEVILLITRDYISGKSEIYTTVSIIDDGVPKFEKWNKINSSFIE